ncbi:MFS transporter [Candidatus Woesearchaeota archaeon]|nr:MFS transporter [Candidatus Woesearchaeota archaeon]
MKPTKQDKWRRNVRLYYVYRVLCTMNFVMPIFMLFLMDKGLTSFQIFVTQAVYTFVEMLLMVPSGAFADKVGRKKTLILSTVLYSAAFLSYSFSQTFTHVLLTETVFAVSSALFHGTGEAFLYDTLAEAKRKNRYKGVLSTAYAVQSVVMGAASVAGGYMAKYGLSMPFLVSALPAALSLVPLLFLDEPHRKKADDQPYLKLMKDAVLFAARHRKLRSVMYYVAVTTLAGYMGFMLYQPLLTKMGMKVEYLGLVVMVLSGMNALGSKLAQRVERRLKRFNLMMLLAGSRAVLYLLVYLADGTYLVVWALLYDLVSGVSLPLVSDWVNRFSKSENRATVLSLSGMSGTLTFSAFSPLLGLYVDAYSEQAAYLLLALALGAYALRQLAVMVYDKVRASG